MFHDEAIISRNKEILSSHINNETVMMDIETGQYIGLDPIASRIWLLIEEPASFSSVCNALTAEYDVDAMQCRSDVAEFLQQSRDANLITVLDA